MPRIVNELLQSSLYLYQTVDDAKEGKSTGGSGFLVSMTSPVGETHLYAVTNKHVTDHGFSVIRSTQRMAWQRRYQRTVRTG